MEDVELHVMFAEQQDLPRCLLECGGVKEVWSALDGIRMQSANATCKKDRDVFIRAIARHCGCDTATDETNSRAKHLVIRQLRKWLVDETASSLEAQLSAGELISLSACANAVWLLETFSDAVQAKRLVDATWCALQAAPADTDEQTQVVLQSKAIWYYVQNQHAIAMPLFKEAKDRYEAAELTPTATRDYASLLNYIGNCSMELKCYEDALEVLTLSKSSYEAMGDIETPGYAMALQSLGMWQEKMGNADEAMNLYTLAEDVFGCLQRTDSLEYARLAKRMGEMLQDDSKHSRAQSWFFAAKHAYESVGIPDNSGYASILKRLGISLREDGDYVQALALLQAAAWTYEDSERKGSLAYATLLKSIAVTQREAGHYKEAMASFEHGQQLYNALGMDITSVEQAALLKSKARCLREQGMYGEALTVYEEARGLLTVAGEAMTRGYAWLLNTMGTCHSDQGHHEEALALFNTAEGIHEKLALKGRRDHSLLLKNKGVCYMEQGMYSEAMAAFEEARRAYEDVGAVTSSEYAMLLKDIGVCSTQRGQLEESLPLLRAAEGICNTDEHVGGWRAHCRVQRAIAEWQIKAGNHREAEEILESALGFAEASRTVGKAQDDKLISDIILSVRLTQTQF